MAMTKFVLGVDLDGVCADFYRGLRPIAAEWLGVPEESLTTQVSYGLPEWGLKSLEQYKDLHRFAVTQRELFERLEPMHGAAPALRRLSDAGIHIRIITHRLFIPHFHKIAVGQTVEWLDHYGFPYWDLCLMKDKAAVGANLYIEDAPVNVAALRSDGHETIVFTNSTNIGVDPPRANSWAEAERLVLERFEVGRLSAKPKELAGV